MSEVVRPALTPAMTPEEWAKRRIEDAYGSSVYVGRVGRRDFLRVWAVDDEGGSSALLGNVLGVAALALSVAGPDGKPLFTREHVLALRLAIYDWESEAGSLDPADDPLSADAINEQRKEHALMLEAVDRLLALLPPEEPEP